MESQQSHLQIDLTHHLMHMSLPVTFHFLTNLHVLHLLMPTVLLEHQAKSAQHAQVSITSIHLMRVLLTRQLQLVTVHFILQHLHVQDV